MRTKDLASLARADEHRLQPAWPWLAMRTTWPTFVTGVVLLWFFIAFLTTIQFSTPNLVGTDDYFHIKFAQVMREQGLRPPFPWLPLTILNPQDYVDHHWLFHVLLIPFTYGDLRIGAKWAGVIFPALAFLAGWIFLRGQRIPFAALWALGFLAVSEAFLFRMGMARVQATSLLLLLLILHVTLTRHERWLLPLTFIYVWLYDAFPMIGLMVGLYVLSCWLLERQLKWLPLVYVGLGIVLALIINPYFPQNLFFIYYHALPKIIEIDSTANVGNEWYPYDTWALVENSAPALIAFVAGTLALGFSQRRISTRTLTLFLITILFGAFLFKSRRFIEYYPAFALLFCALAWTSLLEEWSQARPWLQKLVPAVLVILLIPPMVYNLQATIADFQDSNPYQRYADASAWLKAHTPAGSRLYQTDWDDFPQLYFYNTQNTYTLGLDPTYMELYNAPLYHLWQDINGGRIEAPSQIIAATFGATYVISDLNHRSFLAEARNDPGLVEVYRDDYAVIFQVQPSTTKGAAG
ncbi:MAG: hypothetical protein U0401_30535 [Anaerolineae bacterium]